VEWIRVPDGLDGSYRANQGNRILGESSIIVRTSRV